MHTSRHRLLSIALAALVMSACSKDPTQLLNSANESYKKGDSTSAVLQLKQAIESAPENGELRYALGRIYNDIFDGASAEKEIRRALALGVTDGGRVYVQLARSLRLQARYKDLLAEVKPSAAYEAEAQATILAWRGSSHFALGQLSEARADLAEARAVGRVIAPIFLLEAQLLASDKDLRASQVKVDEAAAKFPTAIDVWSFKADLARMEGDRDTALVAYNKMLEIYPKHMQALVGRSTILLQQNKIADAKADIDRLRASYKSYPATYQQVAMLQIAQQQFREAQETVQQLLKSAPNYPPALVLSGVVNLALGAPIQAEQALSRYVASNPGDLTARRLLGVALVRSNQGQRALEVIEPVLKSDLRDAAVMEIAGDALASMGELGKATAALDEAIGLTQSNKSNLFAKKARIDFRSGEMDLAVEQLENAIKASDRPGRADIELVLANMARGKLDDALAAVNALEKRRPNQAEVINLKAAVLLRRGDQIQARALFEQALKINPSYFPAADNLAALDMAAGKRDDARNRYEAVLAVDKRSLPALMALAAWHRRWGNAQEWRQYLERAAVEHKQAIAPRLQLAEAAMAKGERQKAMAIADELLSVHPDHPAALELVGGLQLQSGEINRAVATFQRLVSLYPKASGAYFSLAQAMLRAGDLKESEAAVKKALALSPDDPRFQRLAIDIMLRSKRVEEALRFTKAVQSRKTTAAQGLVYEGEIYLSQKNFSQAASAFRRALEISPMGDIAVKLYGVRAAGGQTAAALEELTRWVVAHPENQIARFGLAGLLIARSEYKEAVVHLEALLAKTPEDPAILNALASAYLGLGDKRAQETALRAHKLAPSDPLIMDTLGWIEYRRGDRTKGREFINRAVSAAPQVPEIRYHYAITLVDEGNKAKAREALSAALKSDLHFVGRQDAEQLLKSLDG